MIGDAMVDVAAGKAAGFRTALVWNPSRCELCPMRTGFPDEADLRDVNLAALAQRIAASVRS